MVEKVTEEELKLKATGVRVTLEELKANIVKEYYHNYGLLTICVLTLRNGFTVTGESACADPNNYNEDLGKRLAYTDAEKKIWPLMGYHLRQSLYEDPRKLNYLGRMNIELDELNDKFEKLRAYCVSDKMFQDCNEKQRTLLSQQLVEMAGYKEVLSERITLEQQLLIEKSFED